MAPTTLLPFLYQTRTLQRLSRAGAGVSSQTVFRAFLHNSPRRLQYIRAPKPVKEDMIPFELPPDILDEEVDEEARPTTTITPVEREAFNRIFRDLAEKRKRLNPTLENSAPSADDQVDVPDTATDTQPRARRDHPLARTFSAADREAALQRFPETLREAARLAIGGIIEAGDDLAGSETTDADSNNLQNRQTDMLNDLEVGSEAQATPEQNEQLRRLERQRVERRMREAKTDFELWDVLEEEVFAMVDRLAIGEPKNHRRAGRSKGKAEPPATAEDEALPKEKEKLPMHIYGPLYPSYLLAALSLMDRQFARSSPLAFSILPRIKKLGLASYVLGVSTPFYNALAAIHWNRHGDPHAVFDLLEEMRHAGMVGDGETMAIIRSVKQEIGECAGGTYGPFLKERASFPDYEFTVGARVQYWEQAVRGHLAERGEEGGEEGGRGWFWFRGGMVRWLVWEFIDNYTSPGLSLIPGSINRNPTAWTTSEGRMRRSSVHMVGPHLGKSEAKQSRRCRYSM
ncbi:hypothetical protein B0T17DRAFT_639707 [Bombardia bombarda]|uniref:Mtf2-like C-terminal domain-containing protein n=1 Tax=Bombardia bombarda TaxID=252184 RepID=A0AA40C4L0_9PEZI|nr:hypothetical protein B0T17DRAFT_639707 [Bombardia bombarda]